MAKQKSNRWMERHVNDTYVKKSQADGYRSRAAYKLLELDEKDKLFKPGMTIVDLGAAPGGWSQVASERIGESGRIIALDLLPMDSFSQVEFIQGDFREDEVFDKLMKLLNGKSVDLVISDMAPNISGQRVIDQSKSMYLVELALDFALQVLKPGGDFVTKAFEGAGMAEFRKLVQSHFAKSYNRKPGSSRAESRELFIVGKNRIV